MNAELIEAYELVLDDLEAQGIDEATIYKIYSRKSELEESN